MSFNTKNIETKNLQKRRGQDATQGQFWSGIKLIWIQIFLSPRLVTVSRLKQFSLLIMLLEEEKD